MSEQETQKQTFTQTDIDNLKAEHQKAMDDLATKLKSEFKEKEAKAKAEAEKIAKQANFFNPYCGKIYKSEGTEILSMRLEEIFENAIEFSKNDPEYFNFVLDVVQGRI